MGWCLGLKMLGEKWSELRCFLFFVFCFLFFVCVYGPFCSPVCFLKGFSAIQDMWGFFGLEHDGEEAEGEHSEDESGSEEDDSEDETGSEEEEDSEDEEDE